MVIPVSSTSIQEFPVFELTYTNPVVSLINTCAPERVRNLMNSLLGSSSICMEFPLGLKYPSIFGGDSRCIDVVEEPRSISDFVPCVLRPLDNGAKAGLLGLDVLPVVLPLLYSNDGDRKSVV